MESHILYAYAMHLSKVDELPSELIEHFWSNEESRKQIIELYELYDAEMIAAHPHPYFSANSPQKVVDFDWENLEGALEAILRGVLEKQSPVNGALERRMAASYKAAAMVAFEVLTPKKDAVYIQNIHFTFSQAIPQNSELHLKNTQGKTVGRFEVIKDSDQYEVAVRDSKQFPSGLYYWTLLIGTQPITNRLYICTEEDARKIIRES